MMAVMERVRSLFVPKVTELSREAIAETWQKPMRAANERYFAAAHLTRSNSFSSFPSAYNREIYQNLMALRLHSRDLAQNNCYGRNYIELCSTHIVGTDGVVLESKVEGYKGPRADVNKAIEKAWDKWCQKVTCDGRLSFIEVQQQIAMSVARDGECFIVLHRGFPANDFRFALEILDATQVDWLYEEFPDANGVRTQMGITHDQWGKPLGYWVWSADPLDYTARVVRKFIPAKNIIHVYREDRVRGVRGIPWMTASMPMLNMLGQLLNAELASAIAGANQFGVIESDFGEDNESPDDYAISEDPRDTAQEITSEEVSWLGLAPGQKATFPPTMHPNPHLSGFTQNILHAISASNQVAYHSLTGDVSQANYSSARVALLNERDNWKKLQKWFTKQCMDPIFEAWIQMAVLSGELNVPLSAEAACKPHWWARSWEWVDPENDIKASILAIRSGMSTHAEELGTQGRNWRRVFEQLATEQAYQRDLKVNIDLDFAKGGNVAPSDLGAPQSVNTLEQNPAQAIAKPPTPGASNG